MDASFVATLLRTSAEGFAGLAASRFWEDDANELGAAGDGFGAWKAHLREQVLQLAAAVEDGSPAMFAGHQAWLREAGSARGVTSDARDAPMQVEVVAGMPAAVLERTP